MYGFFNLVMIIIIPIIIVITIVFNVKCKYKLNFITGMFIEKTKSGLNGNVIYWLRNFLSIAYKLFKIVITIISTCLFIHKYIYTK